MLLVRKTRKTEEGFETTWSLSEEQVNFLLTFAINSLLQEGLANVEDVMIHGEEAAIDKEIQLEILDSLDEGQMEKQ